MARKSYSEEEREQIREALLTTVIQSIAERGLIHSSIDVLCKKVGISKPSFTVSFPQKRNLSCTHSATNSQGCCTMPGS